MNFCNLYIYNWINEPLLEITNMTFKWPCSQTILDSLLWSYGHQWEETQNETDCNSNCPVKFAQNRINSWIYNFPISIVRRNLYLKNMLINTIYICMTCWLTATKYLGLLSIIVKEWKWKMYRRDPKEPSLGLRGLNKHIYSTLKSGVNNMMAFSTANTVSMFIPQCLYIKL